jgi:hypothetical protein
VPHAIEPAARRLCAVFSIKVSGAKKSGEAQPIFPRPRQEGGSDFTKLCLKKRCATLEKCLFTARMCILFTYLHMNNVFIGKDAVAMHECVFQ